MELTLLFISCIIPNIFSMTLSSMDYKELGQQSKLLNTIGDSDLQVGNKVEEELRDKVINAQLRTNLNTIEHLLNMKYGQEEKHKGDYSHIDKDWIESMLLGDMQSRKGLHKKIGSSNLKNDQYLLDSEEPSDSEYEGSGMDPNLNNENNSLVNIPSWLPTPIQPSITADSHRPPTEGNSDIYFSDTDAFDVTNSDIDVGNADGGDWFSYAFIVYVPILCLAAFFFLCSCSASCYIWHNFR